MGMLRQWSGSGNDTIMEKMWTWLKKQMYPQLLAFLDFFFKNFQSQLFQAVCTYIWCNFLKVITLFDSVFLFYDFKNKTQYWIEICSGSKVSLVLCVIIVVKLLCTLVAMLPVRTGDGIEVYSLGVTAEFPSVTVKSNVKIYFFFPSLNRSLCMGLHTGCFQHSSPHLVTFC